MHHLDHVFVFCRRGAPEAAALEAIGLRPAARRRHRGQGTANVCFGFANAYLELIWVEDEREARATEVARLGLLERSRWRDGAASPFGLCVRPARAADDARDPLPPFAHWDFTPPWAEGTTVRVAGNSALHAEPLLFELRRPYVPEGDPHPWRERPLTNVAIAIPALAQASPLRTLALPGVTFARGDEALLDVTVGPAPHRVHDFRPALPLVLRCC